jgi:hypothetical protein
MFDEYETIGNNVNEPTKMLPAAGRDSTAMVRNHQSVPPNIAIAVISDAVGVNLETYKAA